MFRKWAQVHFFSCYEESPVTPQELDRYAQADRVFDLLGPELAAEGFDLVDVRIFRGGGRLQVRLSVDLPGEERIDLDGCARVSRSAGMFLEEADIFAGAWVLEVSSPGIRRPLRRPEHFMAVVGREVMLKWRPPSDPTSKPLNLRGRLEQCTGDTVIVQPPAPQDAPDSQPEPVTVPLDCVLEANLEHDFDAQEEIRQDRRRRKEENRADRAARRGRSRKPNRQEPDAQ